MATYLVEHNSSGKPFSKWEVVRYIDGRREVVNCCPNERGAEDWAAKYESGYIPAVDLSEEELEARSEAEQAAYYASLKSDRTR